MATETEIDRLVVRLAGDDRSYKEMTAAAPQLARRMVDEIEQQTNRMETIWGKSLDKQAAKSIDHARQEIATVKNIEVAWKGVTDKFSTSLGTPKWIKSFEKVTGLKDITDFISDLKDDSTPLKIAKTVDAVTSLADAISEVTFGTKHGQFSTGFSKEDPALERMRAMNETAQHDREFAKSIQDANKQGDQFNMSPTEKAMDNFRTQLEEKRGGKPQTEENLAHEKYITDEYAASLQKLEQLEFERYKRQHDASQEHTERAINTAIDERIEGIEKETEAIRRQNQVAIGTATRDPSKRKEMLDLQRQEEIAQAKANNANSEAVEISLKQRYADEDRTKAIVDQTKATEEAHRAQVDLNTAIQVSRTTIEDELGLHKKKIELLVAEKLASEGADDATVNDQFQLAKKNRLLEEEIKAMRIVNAITEEQRLEGKAIKEGQFSPQQKYNKEAQHLNLLQKAGAITSRELEIELKKLHNEMERGIKVQDEVAEKERAARAEREKELQKNEPRAAQMIRRQQAVVQTRKQKKEAYDALVAARQEATAAKRRRGIGAAGGVGDEHRQQLANDRNRRNVELAANRQRTQKNVRGARQRGQYDPTYPIDSIIEHKEFLDNLIGEVGPVEHLQGHFQRGLGTGAPTGLGGLGTVGQAALQRRQNNQKPKVEVDISDDGKMQGALTRIIKAVEKAVDPNNPVIRLTPANLPNFGS